MRKILVATALVLTAFVLVGATAYVAAVVDREITARMSELKAQSIAALETILGRKVEYGSISPSFLRYLEIRDLAILDGGQPGKALLTIRRVRVYFSLAHLLARRDPVGALREVKILNTRISLDLEKDREVADLLLRLLRADTAAGDRLRIRVTGASVGFDLKTPDLSVSLADLFFQVEAGSEAVDVSFRGNCSGKLRSGFSFASALKVQGRVDRLFSWSDLTVKLLNFESSLFGTGNQTLQVVWKERKVTVSKIQDSTPVDLQFLADLEKGEYTVNFQSEDLQPDRLFHLSRGLAGYANWLRAPLTASGYVTWRPSDSHVEYAAQAEAYFEDQFPLHGIRVTSSFHGTETQAYFQPLRLASPIGTLAFEGDVPFTSFFPEGVLTLFDVDALGGEHVNASLTIGRFPGKLSVHGARFEIGKLAFDAFDLSLAPIDGGASFELRTSFAGVPQEDLLEAKGDLMFGWHLSSLAAGVGASAEAFSLPSVSVSASLRSIPPEKIYHLLVGMGELSSEQQDVLSLLSRFALTTDITLATNFRDFSLSANPVTITQLDDPSTHMSGSVTMDNSRISVTGFSGTWKGFAVEGGLEGIFAQAGQVGFTSDLKFLGTAYSLRGRFSPRIGLYLAGDNGLEVSFVPTRDGGLSLLAQGERFPVRLPSRTYAVSFNLEGAFSREGDWAIDAPAITVFDVPFLESKTNTVELSLRLTPNLLDIKRARFTDAFSDLEGSASFDYSIPTDAFDPRFIEQLAAQFTVTLKARSPANGAAPSPETYSAKGTLAEGMVSVSLDFTGSPIARIRPFAARGSIWGTGTISGPLSRPSADLTLSLKEGRLGTDMLALSGRVGILPDAIRVQGLSVGYLAHRITDGAGSLDATQGTFRFTAGYRGEFFSDEIRLSALLEGTFAGANLGDVLSGVLSHGLKGKLSLNDLTVQRKPFPGWGIRFTTDNGILSFDGGPGDSLHGTVDTHLAFTMRLANPLPIDGTVQGTLAGDRISSTVNVESLDLLVLNPILKTSIITFTAGVATGQLAVAGPINDPDFTGALDIYGGGITCSYSPDEAGPVSTRLTFNGKDIRSGHVLAAAGATRLSADFGFTVDHWVPVTFDVSLATERQTTAHLTARFGRVIADGLGMGKIRISGSERKTDVTGTLTITDCRITLGEFPSGKFSPEDPPTFVNLTAETGKRVEFFWPSELFPVFRTIASPGGRLLITYRGDTGAYTVKGTTDVQRGEIYYFDRSFIVKSGTIAFNENEQNFDPRITARAEVREWDPRTGEEVRIYLDADSTLSKFTPRFSSDPPRGDTDILAMIGAPLLSRAESQGLGMSAALISSDILSTSYILRPFERKVRELLNLDMFSIRTQLIQNLVAEKFFGAAVNPLDNTSVSLGKYLGNDLFLEMLVRLQSPKPALGSAGFVAAPAGLGSGLSTDLELTLEWATPFFLMEWSFLPKNPESLFLTDNSLSLKWRFSY